MPGDVAVVGGQDIPALSTAWEPTISAIEFDRAQVGREALRLLDRLMAGGHPPAGRLLIPPVGLAARQSSDVRGARDPEVARVRRVIREQAHRPIAVKELLAAGQLSRRALERRFRQTVGHSLHDEIVRERIARSQRLLRMTALSTKEVAAQCGYANYAVFSVAFRRQTGLTATAFRRQCAAPSGGADIS